uniref:Uncharacterized protein n=1 Tax=Acrobeloides nanus TaxID=290746 RepID=A0A914DJS7_9BILA
MVNKKKLTNKKNLTDSFAYYDKWKDANSPNAFALKINNLRVALDKAGPIYGNKLRNRQSEKRMLIKAQLPRKFEESDHTLPQNVFVSDDESQEE